MPVAQVLKRIEIPFKPEQPGFSSSINLEVMLKERRLMGGGYYSSEGAGWALEAAG